MGEERRGRKQKKGGKSDGQTRIFILFFHLDKKE